MGDLKLYETGSGGSVQLKGKDLVVVHGFHNMIYIALFGGNFQSTPTKRPANEQAFDFWGNTFLVPDRGIQFNSTTEKTLGEVALNSEGRQLIESAVLYDLDFMKQFGTITASVEIIGSNVVKILVGIQEPDNKEAKQFTFIWDGTKKDFADAKLEQPAISNSYENQVCPPGTLKIYDLFGNLLATETVLSGQTQSVELDAANNLFLEFPFEVDEVNFKIKTIRSRDQGIITDEDQDGASGTILWNYNELGFVALSTLLPLTLTTGDTIRPSRSVGTSAGWVALIGTYV